MSFLNDLRITRKKFLDGLEANKGDIDMDIFEDFYPDRAHFIYELLQNAEDANASNVRFVLSEESLVCEHDGRPFDEADIRAITGIGTGTKKDDEDKIGRFGIGFKAALVYTDTPRIWSPTFAFEISDMVLPTEMDLDSSLGDRTRFEFPFNSLKKPAPDAFSEVKTGLQEVSAHTLLFLSSIESIDWRVEGETQARLLRKKHSKHHFETLKESNGKATDSSHFLRFIQPVEELKRQYAAIAFELDPLPDGSSSGANAPLAKRFRIAPAKPGRVAVYFDCAKETSGLRFHLHAPFVPELSRASVKDTPANEPLFRQLAMLSANSLSIIRDLGLLNRDFLAVLPNQWDEIPERYKCVREAVVEAMNAHPLTPTHYGRHAPANHLLQARAALKALLSTKDIAVLYDSEGVRNKWAIGATQQNSDIDRFLHSLDIKEWDVEQLVDILKRLGVQSDIKDDGPDKKQLLEWLRSKPGKWHQALYAFLHREFGNRTLHPVWDLRIVRLSNGEYRVGKECYFPTGEDQEDPGFPLVARDTYTSGRKKTEQSAAMEFLVTAGVSEVDELERVKAILEQRYVDEDEAPDMEVHEKDLQRFIALVEGSRQIAAIFSDYRIFRCEGNVWAQPRKVYLDSPYMETGLRAFFNAVRDDDDDEPFALADHYLKWIPKAKERLVDFATATSVQTKLVPMEQQTWNHPHRESLRQYRTRRGYETRTKIDSDWTIPKLESALTHSSTDISRLIWKTMAGLKESMLVARYRPNQQHEARSAPSTLVLTLRKLPWIPQGTGQFVRPAKASRDLLPEGFAFDPGWPWLNAIGFGQENANRIEKHRKKLEEVKELGFPNLNAFERAKKFANLPREAQERILAEHEATTNLPNQQPGNPVRRAERVRREAENAPGRDTSVLRRSVSEHREAVKEEAKIYLREQYTNNDDVMICQVCKAALPFRLDDGNYYFEAVEFLPMLERRHYQNYLALCPNHAAMYVHANSSTEAMMDLFRNLAGNKLEVVLAGEGKTIYFNGTHMADLKTVIDAESSHQ